MRPTCSPAISSWLTRSSRSWAGKWRAPTSSSPSRCRVMVILRSYREKHDGEGGGSVCVWVYVSVCACLAASVWVWQHDLVVPLGLGKPLGQLLHLLGEMFDSFPGVSQELGQVDLRSHSQKNTLSILPHKTFLWRQVIMKVIFYNTNWRINKMEMVLIGLLN